MSQPATKPTTSPSSPSRRDSYRDVGAAMRQALERARAGDLTAGDWQVLSVVLDLTASWSRLVERVYVKQIAHTAGLSERRTRDALAKLAADKRQVIVWRPKRGNSDGKPASEIGLHAVAKPDTQSVRFGEPESGHPERPLSTGESGHPERPVQSGRPERPVLREGDEKNDVEGELDELLEGLGHLSKAQRSELVAAFGESREGFRRCVADAQRGKRPAALLTTLVRAGAHRAPPNGKPKQTPLERAEALVRNLADVDDAARYLEAELRDLGLPHVDRARVLDAAGLRSSPPA